LIEKESFSAGIISDGGFFQLLYPTNSYLERNDTSFFVF